MKCYLDKIEDAYREEGDSFNAQDYVDYELLTYDDMAEALRELMGALADADADQEVANLIAGMTRIYLGQ